MEHLIDTDLEFIKIQKTSLDQVRAFPVIETFLNITVQAIEPNKNKIC